MSNVFNDITDENLKIGVQTEHHPWFYSLVYYFSITLFKAMEGKLNYVIFDNQIIYEKLYFRFTEIYSKFGFL